MKEPSSISEPWAIPGVAVAEGGQVLLDGPNGVAVAMTPDAAEQTGRSLLQAAEEARTQTGSPPSES